MTNKLDSIKIMILLVVIILLTGMLLKNNAEIRELKAARDEATSLAFGDCQRIMAQNEFMVRINTCIEVVNAMCKENTDCMAYFQTMCTSEDHE